MMRRPQRREDCSVTTIGAGLPSDRRGAPWLRATVVAVLLGGCATTETVVATAPVDTATARDTVTGDYLAARHAFRQRDTAAAASRFARVLDSDPANTALMRRAFLAMVEDGRVAESVPYARKLQASSGITPLAALVLGLDAARQGRLDDAVGQFAGLPRTRLNDVLKPLLLGWIAIGKNDPGTAMRRFDDVRAMSGFELLADLHAAYAADLLGDTERAGKYFDAAIAHGTRPAFRVAVATASHYARAGKPDRAAAVAERYADRSRRPIATAPGLGQATDGMAEALFDVASALQRDSGQESAMLYARLALFMREDFPLARILVGEILDDRKRYQDSLAHYQQIKSGTPYYTMAALRAASALQEQGRRDDAIVLLRDLAAALPEDPEPMSRLGDMLRGAERWPEAVAAYDQAIAGAGAGSDWSMLYARGIAHERGGRWKDAETDFLAALKLAPEQPYVMNYLGYSWVDQGINLDEARRMIERAVQLRPNDGFIVDSLGWVLYRLGDYAGAVGQLEKAVQLQPTDATINDHLGDAYWRVGRVQEARFQWRRALSMKPESALLAAIERKLKSGLPSPVTNARDGGARSPGA